MRPVKLLLIISFITACGYSNSRLVKSDVSDEYLNETYGIMSIKKTSAIQSEKRLNYYIKKYRKALAQNDNLENLSGEKSKKKLDKMNNLKFEKNRFFAFEIMPDKPVAEIYTNLKFKIKDKNNKSIPVDVIFIAVVERWVMDNFTEIYYPYTWLIKSSTAVNKTNFSKELLPVHLIVIYLNGKNEVYDISPQ